MPNFKTQKGFSQISMKFSGFMCLGMKNICGYFRCKKKQVRKKLLSNRKVNDVYIYISIPTEDANNLPVATVIQRQGAWI